MNRIKTYLVIGFCVLVFAHVNGQYYTEYGQNRIQYKKFEWVYFSTTHFDIYYYPGGKRYAEQAIDFLEEEFNRLTDILGYAPYSKTKILIYNSIHELQQSNIGIEGAEFSIGGQTDFVKLQLEIAHPGSVVGFRQELVYKMSRVLIEDMLFGGSLAEIFQSAYLLSLPKWFIDGAARYLAYGWSSDMDDHIRDYLSRRSIKKLIKIDGDEAGLVGQSVWNYIAIKYGRSNVSNILNLTRIIRNEENSIASTVGMTYKQFLREWQNYYIQSQEEIASNYSSPDDDRILVNTRKIQTKYKNVRVNPSGTRVAYSKNEIGRYKIYVHDNETGKTDKLLTSGLRVKGQQPDFDLPLLDWINDDQLGILYYRRGYLSIVSYNVETGEKLTKPLQRFDQIKSFSFNENGRLAVVSGDVDGKNDIFLISMRRNAVRRITTDIYDDLDPVFVPGTAAIVFSSNRPNDSLNIADQSIEEVSENFNIFLYDLDTTKNQFARLTKTFSKDTRPIPKGPYEIYYLSDQRGITNLFKYQLQDSTFIQVTNFDKSIKDYDLHFNGQGIVYLMFEGGTDKVYYDEDLDIDSPKFSPQTIRQRLRQAQFIADLYSERNVKVAESPPINLELESDDPEVVSEEEVEKTDPYLVDPDNYQFDEDVSENYIDTEDYRFETSEPSIEDRFRPESFFTNYQKLELSDKILGPIPYEPQFSFDNLVTSFAIDQLRGFGVVLETQISDMLGNHKLKGGAFADTDLNSGDIYVEYNFLKYWMDLKARVDRKSYFFQSPSENELRQRYNYTRVMIGGSVPLTNWFRLEVDPFFIQTNFRNLQFETIINSGSLDNAPDRSARYGGFVAKAVFDDTIERGFNLLQGTRAAVEFIHNQGLSGSNLTFSNIRFDLRHYQPIHREITLASRIFYGQSIGQNKQNFLVGGVPNWFFARTKSHPENDPLRIGNDIYNGNLLFTEFVTNLRGFAFSELYGNSAFLFNTELRFPVFQYFSRGPINSTFLRNFILIGFFDLGSAWNGPPPLTRENSSNKIVYKPEGSIFTAEISNFRNPWLASYGFGFRTVMLGYYAKFDYAVPIRDFELLESRISVSVGLDF